MRPFTPLAIVRAQVLKWLEEGKDVRNGEWGLNEIEVLNKQQVRRSKPRRELR